MIPGAAGEEKLKQTSRKEHVRNGVDATTAEAQTFTSATLGNVNEHFMRLVLGGNVQQVQRHLCGNKVDLAARDENGKTVLIYAVLSKNVELLKLLLEVETLKEDILLHAVKTGDVDCFQAIMSYIRADPSRVSLEKNCPSSLFFNRNLTPLVLALIEGQTEIAELLIVDYGHTLETAHRITCRCPTCMKTRMYSDVLSEAVHRLDVSTAMSSEDYLTSSLVTDPFLTAFLLTREMLKCASLEKEYKDKYVELSVQLRQFSCKFADEFKTESEVLTFFRNKDFSLDTSMCWPRFRVALDYHQMEFVTNPRVLVPVTNIWLGTWANWASRAPRQNLGRLLLHTLFYPFVCLACLFLPPVSENSKEPESIAANNSTSNFAEASGVSSETNHNTSFSSSFRSVYRDFRRSCENPYARFLRFSASYSFFLCLLVYQVGFVDKPNRRGPPEGNFKWYVFMYIIGFAWMDYKLAWKYGFRRFFEVWWHWFDVTFLLSFFCSFICWIWAWLDSDIHDIDRVRWYEFDATLLAEAIFTISAVFAAWRILYLLQQHYKIGPIVGSLGHSVSHLIRYFVIFALILLAFSVGLTFLSQDYKEQVQLKQDGSTVRHPKNFISMEESVRWLHWSVYGYTPPDFMNVIIAAIGYVNDTVIYNYHTFTQKLIEAMNGAYNVILIIILLNLMVAMMCGAVSDVLANQDVEWTFVRCQMWAEFFEENTTLPPPFNLLPSASTILFIYHWLTAKVHSSNEFEALEVAAQKRKRYLKLMRTLKRRFNLTRIYERVKQDKLVGIKPSFEGIAQERAVAKLEGQLALRAKEDEIIMLEEAKKLQDI